MNPTCPACGARIAGQTVCRCGADLSVLHQLAAIGNAWFNRALQAMKDNQPGRALEWISACCAAQPTDAEARRVQAKIWARLGKYAEAADALKRAMDLAPEAAGVKEMQEKIEKGISNMEF